MSIDALAFEVNPLSIKSASSRSDPITDIEHISKETEEKLDAMVKNYLAFSHVFFDGKHRKNRLVKCFFNENGIDGLMSPTDIYHLSLRIVARYPPDEATYDMHYQVGSHPFSEYFRHLINVSYNDGNNGFSLCVGELGVDYLLRAFPTYPDNKLRLLVDGELGDKAFAYLHHSDIIVNYSVGGYAANDVANLHLRIDGNAGFEFAKHAHHSHFTIDGEAYAYGFAHGATHSTFAVNNLIGNAKAKFRWLSSKASSDIEGSLSTTKVKPKDCTFNVKDEATYEALMQTYHMGGRNTINLVSE